MPTQTRFVLSRSSVLAASVLFTGACSNGYYTCAESRTCAPDKATPDASPDSAVAPALRAGTGGAANAKSGAGGQGAGAGGSSPLGTASGSPGSGDATDATTAVNDARADARVESDAGPSQTDDAGIVREPDAHVPEKDPCAACDSHARCTPTAATPCQCVQGYRGDGQTCARDLCQPLEGEGPPCGANATCTSSGAARTCACTTGFATCDGPSDPTKGCETTLASDPKNCGQCGFGCAGHLSCSSGICTQAVMKLALGFHASFALLPQAPGALTGRVYGWGSNSSGALAAADTSRVDTMPTSMPTLGGVRDLAASAGHVCVLAAASDTVLCWGQDSGGDLGTTASVPAGTVVNTLVPGAVELALGGSSTCVRTQTGRVSCWGLGSELGTAANTSSPAPVDVPGITDARRLFGGSAGHCALRGDDTMSCWGSAPFSQSPAPLLEADGSPVSGATSVAIAGNTYCIARKNGTVACAGGNGFGQLGQGTVDASTHGQLVTVPGLSGVAEVSGRYFHFCARTSSGSLYCWGPSEFGALGLGSNIGSIPAGGTIHVVPTPTLVPGLSGVLEVAAGFVDTCVRLKTGQVQCFGSNTDATIGDGTQIQRVSAVNVVGLP
jgi:alpha-tubulin suppressor-like RCC1 family protein